jgi:integrase
MTAACTPRLTTTATCADVLAWAKASGENADAIRELERVPARLGLLDADLGLVPADPGFFEASIAPTAFALVSKAQNQKDARRRANSRLRSLLRRYHAAHAAPSEPKAATTPEWDRLVDFVRSNEGFPGRGALFSRSTHRALYIFVARARCAPADLDQAEIDRIAAACSAEKRKTLRKAIRFLNRLIRDREAIAEIASLLSEHPVPLPTPVGRVRRILWDSLPVAFRSSVEAAFASTLAGPDEWVEDAYARIAAGEDAVLVMAELNADAPKRRRPPRNRAAALSGYRAAVVWLVRAAEETGLAAKDLARIEDVLTFPIIAAAAAGEAARRTCRPGTSTPRKSQTLNSRLMAIRTVCGRGLRRPDLLAGLDIIEKKHRAAIVKPSQAEMPQEIAEFCRSLRDHPDIAARLLRGPWHLAGIAEEKLKAAKTPAAELSALRLYICAALLALQMSRPVRPENLIRLRLRGSEDLRGNVRWLKDRSRLRIEFGKGEIKNHNLVGVPVTGQDAEILWRWQHELRPRYIALRGISDSPYLFPGTSIPRLVADGLPLPAGCLSVSSFAAIWNDGMEHLGLSLTPHMCRHAVATLILAIEPGNFAKAAAVLADTEDTVRKHYGQDSGEAASKSIRAHLLSAFPDIFRQIRARRV